MAKDYYKIFGIDKNASQEDIKKTFRKLAHEHHPDKVGGNEAKFKEINEAYQVLGNPEKRKQYDQFGSTFEDQGGFGGGIHWEDFMRQARGSGNGNGFSSSGFSFDFGDLGDLFGFGGGNRARRKTRENGEDIHLEVELSFREAVFGDEKEFEISRRQLCEHCKGNGAEPGTKIISCERCKGVGVLHRIQQTFLGAIQTQTHCPECRGQGKKNEKNCQICNGSGVVHGSKRLRIKIPRGINNGETVRLQKEGEAGVLGASAGDLYITVRVKSDPEFRRDGYDIYSEVFLSFSVAVLGGKIKIQTLDGNIELKIPEGTSHGSIFKLRGKGVYHLESSKRGDHLAKIKIKIPKHLTKNQRNLLQSLEDEGL